MIDRRSVLELIGKHRGKYHSCLLTCYSFDFSFFEERVLPTLRTANIKNVNVLADGHFLELAQEITTGKEFRHNKTYNFQPIYAKGVFHPKIMLLTGLKHGLLIIGSGNMTSSGLSTNDEIWGAFHLDNITNENGPLFSEVWKYLQKFTAESHGFISQKMDWISKYSPWLNELPNANGPITLESINQTIQFVGNSKDKTSYQYIVDSIPNAEVKTLTVISPYFDNGGVVLEEFYNLFKPKVFNCIVDLNSGLLPHGLAKSIADNIKFYNWSDCKKDYEETFNRLHAKIFHFELEDGTEFLFLGSANATKEAMGTSKFGAVNDEAGVILKRTVTGNWLKELGILIPTESIEIPEGHRNKGLGDNAVPRKKYEHRILYSELRGNEISIFIHNEPSENLTLSILSRDDNQHDVTLGKLEKNCIVFKSEDPDSVFKVFLSKNDERISNYSIVHRFESLIRCNPDPNQEKLDALLEEEYPDGEGVTSLLQYVDYNWADEDESNIKVGSNNSSYGQRAIEIDSSRREYEKLNSKEFNTISVELLAKQSGELTNSNLKIAEFLNLLNVGSSNKNEDFIESEEQKLLEDDDQKGDGEDVQTSITKKNIANREKKAISSYFRKLDDSYSSLLSPFYDAKALSVSPDEKITIRSLSNILISLQLIQIYHGKKYTLIDDNNEEPNLKEESYLLDGNIFSGSDSVKGYFANVYGKFLLLSCAGMKSYDYEILNQKLDYNRFQVTLKSIFTLLNMNWRENEKNYLKTLLLNTLYFVNPKPIDKALSDELKEKLNTYKLNSKYVSIDFDKNMQDFMDSFLNNMVLWYSKFNNMSERKLHLIQDTNEVKYGDIIFNSKIGFVEVSRIHKSDQPQLDLSREGFPMLEGGFLVDKITFGSKCVSYPF